MEIVLTKCICFNGEDERNCEAETLGAFCQDNHSCPIRKTWEATRDDNWYGAQWLEDTYDGHINAQCDKQREDRYMSANEAEDFARDCVVLEAENAVY